MIPRTLNEILRALGYRTAPAAHGRKHIIRSTRTRSDIVHTGTASANCDWLESTGQHRISCAELAEIVVMAQERAARRAA